MFGYDGNDHINEHNIKVFLLCSFAAWFLCNAMFFSLINTGYMGTFFDTKTASQYTIERFLTSKEDFLKFDAAFVNRLSFTKPIHDEIKIWVANNIETWRADGEKWFDIGLIPDEMLSREALLAEGGSQKRRRSSVSLREIFGSNTNDRSKVHPENENTPTRDRAEQQHAALLKSLEERQIHSSATTVKKKRDLRDVAEKTK